MEAMVETQQIRDAVTRAMERVNDLLLAENSLSCDDENVLLGNGAQLDSMGFVNFMIALEDELAGQTGWVLNLAEELNSRKGAVPETMTAADFVNFLAGIARDGKSFIRLDMQAR
jgi:hypothetical protein